MNNSTKNALDAALFLVVFVVIQFAISKVASYIFDVESQKALVYVACSIATSVVTIALFAWRKWAPLSGNYVRTRPWGTLFWVATTSIGAFVVSLWLQELAHADMPDSTVQVFVQIMSHDWGYLAIGMLAPIAEEMVFRGAILRVLLKAFDKRMHWLPIAMSAILFGLVHGNMAQAMNAFLLGLLLGWLYYRTDSIVPGVVFHWINNTVVYVMFVLMPGTADMGLTELCGGDNRKVTAMVVFALCVMLPSLYQLSFRLRKR